VIPPPVSFGRPSHAARYGITFLVHVQVTAALSPPMPASCVSSPARGCHLKDLPCPASQIRRLRKLAKRLGRIKPWVNPHDTAAAASAAEDLARREAAAAAAAEALLNVRVLRHLLSLAPHDSELQKCPQRLALDVTQAIDKV